MSQCLTELSHSDAQTHELRDIEYLFMERKYANPGYYRAKEKWKFSYIWQGLLTRAKNATRFSIASTPFYVRSLVGNLVDRAFFLRISHYSPGSITCSLVCCVSDLMSHPCFRNPFLHFNVSRFHVIASSDFDFPDRTITWGQQLLEIGSKGQYNHLFYYTIAFFEFFL